MLQQGANLLKGKMIQVDEGVQRREALFMIGEAATLRKETQSMSSLHEDVSTESAELLARAAEQAKPVEKIIGAHGGREPIAIVGMACLFPDSPDLETYWQNILKKFDPICEVPPDRWPADLYYSEDRFERDKLYSKHGSFLGPMRFDPLRYMIPPASLPSVDPIQLMTLEVARLALRDARDRPLAHEWVYYWIGTGTHRGGIVSGFATADADGIVRIRFAPEGKLELRLEARGRETIRLDPSWSPPGGKLIVRTGVR